MVPYHASGGKNDTCFPDWALSKLRMGGAALLQGVNGTNSTNGTSANDVYVACLKELEESVHGIAGLSAMCRTFVQRMQTDEESGHSEAEEGDYIHADEGTDGTVQQHEQHEDHFVAESLEELPDWLRQKFEDALAKHVSTLQNK
eukprot:NODE_19231_length_853_cov_6.334711.p1 GENE.NODE_19231_length_853_cov_6.334711~~NODE_19231_length_853_cov_6.334711.p1  ORF type:complete len:145 (+),score=48.46 NODE_19231_length_853_cov_6.334711:3-437(+)